MVFSLKCIYVIHLPCKSSFVRNRDISDFWIICGIWKFFIYRNRNGSLSFTFSFVCSFIQQIYIEVMVLGQTGEFNKVSAFYVRGIGVNWKKKLMNTYLITDYDRDLIRVLKYFRRKEISLRCHLNWILKGTRKSDMEERTVQAEGAIWTKRKAGKSSAYSRNWKEANVVWDEIKAVCGNQTYPGKAYKISFIQGALRGAIIVFLSLWASDL